MQMLSKKTFFLVVLPNFGPITNDDKSKINCIRFNLQGLFLMKNKMQAKSDFLSLANILYTSKKNKEIS